MKKRGSPEPIALLNRVPVVDCPGELPLVDLRDTSPKLKIVRRKVIPYVRPIIAKMINAAIELLPEGYHMGLFEAWRPIGRQKVIYERYFNRLKHEKPHLPYSTLRRMVNKFLAPYDQKAPPGHSTGAAVDVGLYGDNGKRLDMSSPLKGLDAAYTYHKGLSDTAKANRKIMLDAMFAVGFSNCRDEFWHFSYGDAAWAVRIGADKCFFDRVDLPGELWGDYDKIEDDIKPFE